MPIQLTTRCLRVEGVIGDIRRQVNVVREINLPSPARYIESVDTKIKNTEYKIIPNKVVVEATVHRQVYYVDCETGAVLEYTLPDEKITEFVHMDGARPCDDQTAKVKVDIEYCETEAIDQAGDDCCHEKFQQTCIFRLHVKIMETLEVPVITALEGANLYPTYELICVDNVIAAGQEQYSLADSYIKVPDDTKKIKLVDAEIRDVEKKVIPNKVIIKGKLHKQIYYVEQCSGEVKETHADVPFSVFIHLDGACPDSNVTTDVEIEYLDSELVMRGGEKFVKETAILQVKAKLIEPVSLNVLTAVEGALAETQSVCIENMVGYGCRQVNIMADISTPELARKVSWIETHLRDLTSEVIPNKVIVKGVLEKHIYYVSDCDDQLRALCVREPFTEFIHIDGAQEDDTVDVWGRVEFCDLEPKTEKPTCEWRQTAIVEICAQVTESQQLTFVTGVTEIQQAEEPEPEEVLPETLPETQPEPQPNLCPPGTTFDYTVQPGDTMDKIAKNHGVSTNQVIRANPGIANPNMIYPGQVIQVPCPGGMG